MSDTDDTDVLLLIPPDFFHVHSDSDDSYYVKKQRECYERRSDVVESIITQINKLERRLNKIEVNKETSPLNSYESDSTAVPISDMSALHQATGNKDIRYFLNDNYMSSSSKSTPQKPRTKLVMGSLPNSPNVDKLAYCNHRKMQQNLNSGSTDADESSLQTTPEKKNNKEILGEIDQFLTHVKTIQMYNTQKSIQPSKSINKHEGLINLAESPLKITDLLQNGPDSYENPLHLEDVNRLLQAVEFQQKFIENREKLVAGEDAFTNSVAWKCGENGNTVPDHGYGMKTAMYSDQTAQNQRKNEDLCAKTVLEQGAKSESASTSDSTFHTVLDKGSSCNIHPLQCNEGSNSQFQNPQNRIENFNSVQKFSKQISNKHGFVPANNQNLPLQNGQKVSKSSSHTTQMFSSQPSNSMSSVNLYSLTDLWNSNMKDELVISNKEMKKLLPKLEEEKCRRKHCEKLIQDLQVKVLEMQQRLAVALQVDSAKDEAILRFHEAWEKVAERWQSLETERNALSERLYAAEEKSSSELLVATQKIVHYEQEMGRIMDLAQNNQDICDALEKEKSELCCQLEKLHDDLKRTQTNLQDVLHQRENLVEKIIDLEKESLNDKKLMLETQNELTECKSSLLKCQNELASLRADYGKLEEHFEDNKMYISDLESQKKNIQQTLENFKKNELSLKQELKDLQETANRTKHDLRTFYQHQVETLVKDKLKEFQAQLEQAEKSLQQELQNKEHTIARSAAKQIQKLTEKHRLEIQLVEEKQKEEARLYELQYTQMKQQVNILQQQLDATQARRANIAQELRGIMEAQWLEAVRLINNGKSPVSNSSQYTVALQTTPEAKLGISDTRIPVKEDSKGGGEPVTDRTGQVGVTGADHSTHCYDTAEMPFKSKSEMFTAQNTDDIQKYMKMLLDRMPDSMPAKPKKSQPQFDGTITDYLDDTAWYHMQFSGGKDCDNRATNYKENRMAKPPWK